MINYKGKVAARRLYEEFGLSSSHDFEVEDLVHARDIIYEEKALPHSDGRIVFGKSKAMNSICRSKAVYHRSRIGALRNASGV